MIAREWTMQELSGILCESDQEAYKSIAQIMLTRFRTGPFVAELQMLHQFVSRSPADRELRCLVVGIYFGSSFLVVHTRRLARTLNRSKSAVNYLLQRLGFIGAREVNNLRDFFARVVPPSASAAICSSSWAVRRISDPRRRDQFFSGFPSVVAEEVRAPVLAEVGATPPESTPVHESVWPLWDLHSLLSRPPSFTGVSSGL